MATVTKYQTKAGRRWRVRYRTPEHQQTDKRGFKTKDEALQWLTEHEHSKIIGAYVDPRSALVTIDEIGGPWVTAKKNVLKPSSWTPLEIEWRLRVSPKWGSVQIGKIRHSEVQEWVSAIAQKRSTTTVNRAYGVLAGILDTAVLDRRIPVNPARGVKLPPKTERRHRYLTADQLLTLAEATGEHEALILALGFTGLRWGEATALRVRDLDFTKGRLHVRENAVQVGGRVYVGTPKNNRTRTVPFPGIIELALKQQIIGKKADELVFGEGIDGYQLRPHAGGQHVGWFRRGLTTAGIPMMTPHDLRHTAASLMVAAGANVKAVQRALGHQSAAMTLDRYADLFDDDLDDVSARLNEQVLSTTVGKNWANRHKKNTGK